MNLSGLCFILFVSVKRGPDGVPLLHRGGSYLAVVQVSGAHSGNRFAAQFLSVLNNRGAC